MSIFFSWMNWVERNREKVEEWINQHSKYFLNGNSIFIIALILLMLSSFEMIYSFYSLSHILFNMWILLFLDIFMTTMYYNERVYWHFTLLDEGYSLITSKALWSKDLDIKLTLHLTRNSHIPRVCNSIPWNPTTIHAI